MTKTPEKITWNDEMDEALKAYAADGLSGTRIAEEITKQFQLKFEMSRNAVIGRAHRKGYALATRSQKHKKIVGQRKTTQDNAAQNRTTVKPAVKSIVNIFRSTTPIEGLRITDLGLRDCRWTESEGHPADYIFCGKEKKPGSSYCAEHHRRVYYKTPRKY